LPPLFTHHGHSYIVEVVGKACTPSPSPHLHPTRVMILCLCLPAWVDTDILDGICRGVCRLPHPHPTPWPIPLLADQVVRGHAGSAYAVLLTSSGAHVPWPFSLAHCTVSSPVAPLAFGTSEAVVGVCAWGCACGWGEGWVHEDQYSVQTRCARPFEHTLLSRAPLPRHPFS
jgi:hypothetical protein